jgi:putative copper export protein
VGTIARLVLYLGATLAIGDATARLARVFVGAHERGDGAARVGWFLVVAASALLMVAQLRALELEPTFESVRMLVGATTWGAGWAWLAGAGTLGLLASVVARVPAALRVVAALLLAAAMSGLGHAAADPSPLVARALDVLHVLGVGAWLGTLALVAPLRQEEPTAVGAWARFSRMATVAAPVVVFSGVAAALRRVGDASVPVVVASDYGRLLGLKVALALAVLALGVVHRRRVLATRVPPAVGVRTELLLAAAVLAATALLTGSEPPGAETNEG